MAEVIGAGAVRAVPGQYAGQYERGEATCELAGLLKSRDVHLEASALPLDARSGQ